MKTQIEACLRESLSVTRDKVLAESGFSRRERSVAYARQLKQATQRIDINVEIRPADQPDSAPAVYPWLDVKIPAIKGLLLSMVNGDVSLLSGSSGTTLREPIEFTSARVADARWFVYQADSVPSVACNLKSFLQKWTLPFLDIYQNPSEVCRLFDRNDGRVINDMAQVLRVVAAMVLCGRVADAYVVMNDWFGRAGSRKRYDAVFEYLARVGADSPEKIPRDVR